jgi:hypothetical protein
MIEVGAEDTMTGGLELAADVAFAACRFMNGPVEGLDREQGAHGPCSAQKCGPS